MKDKCKIDTILLTMDAPFPPIHVGRKTSIKIDSVNYLHLTLGYFYN